VGSLTGIDDRADGDAGGVECGQVLLAVCHESRVIVVIAALGLRMIQSLFRYVFRYCFETADDCQYR
jgi:hypothetical protein